MNSGSWGFCLAQQIFTEHLLVSETEQDTGKERYINRDLSDREDRWVKLIVNWFNFLPRAASRQ